MVMSPRTKMRRYRERMSEAQRAAARERNRLQQAECRKKWSPGRREQEQRKNTVIKQKLRNAKKPKRIDKLPSASPAFSTRQAAGKAMKKVIQALPSTPRRRSAVIQKLYSEQCTVVQPQAKKRLFSPETVDIVHKFYEQDDISRQLPGRKDFVTVTDDGKKYQKQKKILVMNVMEAYQLFKHEYENVKIGKSKFASLRPPHVFICSDKDHNVCCCVYHENFKLLRVEGLRNINKDIPLEAELLDAAVCQVKSERCFLGECEKCSDVNSVLEDHLAKLAGTAQFTYTQWNKSSVKETVTSTLEETKSLLVKQLKQMRWHSFIAKHQLNQIRSLKEGLTDEEVVLQEDFSENFNIKQQNEIMSAHWKQTDNSQVTLFTAIMYASASVFLSFVVVSDCLVHDKNAVAAFNRKIFAEAEKSKFPLQTVHVFSDGAGGQFKNCYNLSLLTSPHVLNKNIEKMDWSFFATAHGKGPIDGIGGTVKRAVWRRILQERSVINTAREFALVADEVCPSIKILFVSKDEVEAVKNELSVFWSKNIPKTIPETRKYHYFKSKSSSEIEVADVSQFQRGSDAENLCRRSFQIFRDPKEQSTDGQASRLPADDHETSSRTCEGNAQQKQTPAPSSFGTGTQEASSHVHMSRFITFLQGKGLVLDGITPSDGNCFFWAIIKQLHEIEIIVKQSELRKLTVNHLKNLPLQEKETLQEFLPSGSFDDYVRDMSKDGTYADHVAIHACSKALKVAFQILQISGDTIVGAEFDKQVMVGYIPEIQHYVAITSKAEEQDIEIALENYYAVDYVDRFYIGRVISAEGEGFWKVNFLHQHSIDGVLHFQWPKRRDADIVHNSCIFFGPIYLSGCLDYTVDNIADIVSAFKARNGN